MTIERRELMSNGLFDYCFESEREKGEERKKKGEEREKEGEREKREIKISVEICPVITMKLLFCFAKLNRCQASKKSCFSEDLNYKRETEN
jgi:hypothetical protein